MNKSKFSSPNSQSETSKFPLYNILYDHVKNNEKTILKKDKKMFISFVENNENVHEIIYTIIRIYDLKHNKKKTSEIYNIPYKGKEENLSVSPFRLGELINLNDYTFNIDNFPLRLQKMLIHFMNINNSDD